MSFPVSSPAFASGASIPRKHTSDGEDVSPPLTWSGVPPAARELALIMDDPDAPTPQPWVHWLLYKIPITLTSLPEGVPPGTSPITPMGAAQGRNSWSTPGYRGPAPPRGHGRHRYNFKLYALDRPLDARPGLTKDELLAKMKGHILAQGELIGTYQR